MGGYSDVKRKRIKKLLNFLSKKDCVEISKGGKHSIIIKYHFWKRPFPIPFKNNVVNKHIVKELRDVSIKSEICTKEEFEENIR